MICPNCGRDYLIESCPCTRGARVKRPCIHKGEKAGRLSCGCGVAYHCTLYGVYCSERRPKEELFTVTLNLSVGSVQLSEESYRCCSGCQDRANT